MPENDWWKDLKKQWRIAATILKDCAFLALWVICYWVLDKYVTNKLELFGIEKLIVSVFKYTFAASTFIMVLAFLVRDIGKLAITVWKELKELWYVKELSKVNDPSDKGKDSNSI